MRRVRHILSILRNIFAAAFHKVQAQPALTVEVQSANPLRTQFASRSRTQTALRFDVQACHKVRTQTVLRFDAQACHKLRTLAVRPVLALALTAVLVLASCERRPLEEMSNTHYVRVYVDEHLLNVTEGFYNESNIRPNYHTPQIVRIVLTDPQTGLTRADRYLRNQGDDERGHFYDGYIIADPGEYDLLAYNFDTEATLLENPNNFNAARAYTNEIASHLKTRLASRAGSAVEGPLNEKIVYDPDHLFVASAKGVNIPYSNRIDTLRTPEGGYFKAESVVKSYYLQVRVKGMRYVSSAVSLLDGMAGSAFITSREMCEDDPVTVYFEMSPGAESSAAGVRAVKSGSSDPASDEVLLYTTFGTFGNIPSAPNRLEITFDFTTVYGKPYYETFDITDIFATPDAVEHQWLLIDEVIEIPEPPKNPGGGFNPGVDEWGDVNTDIII